MELFVKLQTGELPSLKLNFIVISSLQKKILRSKFPTVPENNESKSLTASHALKQSLTKNNGKG
jgi:hypothetical protein